MAPTTFYTGECSPEWMLWRKTLPGNEPGSLNRTVSTGDLGSKRQEEFIQTPLRKEVTHELWSTLDQNHVTPAYTADRLQDRLGAQCTIALGRHGLNRRWKAGWAYPL